MGKSKSRCICTIYHLCPESSRWISEIYLLHVSFHFTSLAFPSHRMLFSLFCSRFGNAFFGLHDIPFLCAYLTSTAFQLLLSFWTSLDKFSFTYHMPHHFWHPFICSLELRLGSWLFSLLLLLFNLTIWEEVKRSFPLGLGTYGWWTRILHFKILHQCSGYTPRGTLDPYHNSVEPDTQSAPGLPLTCFGFSPQGSYSSLPREWGKGRKINRLRSWARSYSKGDELRLGSSSPSSLGPLPAKELCLAFSFIFHPAKSLLFAKIKLASMTLTFLLPLVLHFFSPGKTPKFHIQGSSPSFLWNVCILPVFSPSWAMVVKLFGFSSTHLTSLKCQGEVKSCLFPWSLLSKFTNHGTML